MSDEPSPPPALPPRPPAPVWIAPPQWGPPPAYPNAQPVASPFAAPYAAAPRGQFAETAPRRTSAVGVAALVLALLAAVGASTAGAIAAFGIGTGTGPADFESQASNGLTFLTPVRDWVLLAEVSLWIGTGLGVWAIIQAIVAIATGRGRIAAIIALVVAVVGPVIFFAAAIICLGLGLNAGSAPGGPS